LGRMEGLLDQWLWKEEDGGGDRYPLPQDLLYNLPLALGFIALHYVFERAIAIPLSRQLGVRDRVWIRAPSVPKLETFYKRNKHQPSQFWDHSECWRGYPKQPVAEAHYWYYITELSFYWSLLFCVCGCKDFKEQIIHHIATVFLIGFSYCANYVHVGTQVMLVHYSSDFLLEVGDQSQLTSLTQIIHTMEKDERSDEESEKGTLNSKLALLANNCVLNNLTNHGNMNSRLPKAFSSPSTVYAGNIQCIRKVFRPLPFFHILLQPYSKME
uniref:Ceramide synthase 4a n=1 Tax=Oncorhynchus mykiss TaxID=8022 RepID=A0A8C7LVX2_ONCMY